MTRREQVQKEIDRRYSNYAPKKAGFVEGAEWADVNPIPTLGVFDEQIAMKQMEISKLEQMLAIAEEAMTKFHPKICLKCILCEALAKIQELKIK